MNYFAHGRLYVDDPYFTAGTALPDWLSVIDRRTRIRPKHLRGRAADNGDPRFTRLAEGVAQHHHDDGWFHQTLAFTELSWQFTVDVRDALPPDESFRPSFLGHILVELLLDAVLIEENPQRLEDYYASIEAVDAAIVEQFVERLVGRKADRLAFFVGLFCSERFLDDYADDERLVYRLNQVLRRVKMPKLDDAFFRILPDARQRVRRRKDELLLSSDKTDTNVRPQN